MEAGRVRRAVFIGSGNVASSLAPAVDAVDGWSVAQVYSPTPGHASALASRLDSASAVSIPTDVVSNADVYIISVRDDAVDSVVDMFRTHAPGALWLHTSGTLGIERIAPLGPRHGVFYPLQTFSRFKPLDMRGIPVFVEGSDHVTLGETEELARHVSGRVYRTDSDMRRLIHVAAVFGCNFVNHMWAIAEEILSTGGMGLDVIAPLLRETLDKALAGSPRDGQTGPAVRGDNGVMEAHMAILGHDRAGVYRILSDSIMKMYR